MDYAALQVTLRRLLDAYGMTVQVTLRTGGTYVTSTSTAPVSELTKDVRAIFVAPGKGLKVIPPEAIQGSARLLLDPVACGQLPEPGDYVDVGVRRYTVLDSNEISPAGTPVAYFVNVTG